MLRANNFFCFCLWAFPLILCARDTLQIATLQQAGKLMPKIEVWMDVSNKATIDQVRQAAFIPGQHDMIVPLDTVCWVRFSLRNDSPKAQAILLDAGMFDYLELYQERRAYPCRAGFLTNWRDRAYCPNRLLLPDTLPPGVTKTYFLSVRNLLRSIENRLLVSVQSEEYAKDVLKKTRNSGYLIFNGAFLGIILLFLIFTLCQYFFNRREGGYLPYIAYLFGIFCYYLRLLEGTGEIDLFFANFFEKWYWLEAPLAFWCFIAYSIFVWVFLDLSKTDPTLIIVFKYTLGLIVLHGILDFFLQATGQTTVAYFIYFWGRAVYVIVSLYIVTRVFRQQDALPKFIMIGTGLLVLFGFMSMLLFAKQYGSMGIFNDILPIREGDLWRMPIFPMQMGILLEVLCFSVGLGYRNHLLSLNTQKALRLERDIIEAKLKAFRAQLTPHFYGHCLDSIKQMVKAGQVNHAAEYLEEFERLLRMTLEHSEKKAVSIEEELEFCRLYLKMEGLRFTKGNFDYEINVETGIDPTFYELPPMLLQPFLENAVWHGMPVDRGGKIKILVEALPNGVCCIIEDNGIGREEARKKMPITPLKRHSFGVRLSEDRIRSFNELVGTRIKAQILDLHGLDNQATGTRVEIEIPD